MATGEGTSWAFVPLSTAFSIALVHSFIWCVVCAAVLKDLGTVLEDRLPGFLALHCPALFNVV